MAQLTPEQFEHLLNENEGSSLDFKRSQYKFLNANEEEKSELLKDILAFANAFRRADAYILIGVQEKENGKAEIVGITENIDDAQLQQFINTKTQRPTEFSYFSFQRGEQIVAAIRIPVQHRPIYLVKDYGKLKKNIVYIRRGSATAEASPDEIAQMGNSFGSSHMAIPQIRITFEDNSEILKIKLAPYIKDDLNINEIVEKYKNSHPHINFSLKQTQFTKSFVNPFLGKESIDDYNKYLDKCYKEYETFLNTQTKYNKLTQHVRTCNLIMSNIGSAPAENLDIYLHFPDGCNLYNDSTLPEKPKQPKLPLDYQKYI